jgi:hypothetical protein
LADRVREIFREFTGGLPGLDDSLWQDVEKLYQKILDNFSLFDHALENDDPALLGEFYARHEAVLGMQSDLYEQYTGGQGYRRQPSEGFSFLVLVESLVNIDGHIAGMAELWRGSLSGHA